MHCGICGSERLTPIGELRTNNEGRARLRLMFARPGLFRAKPTYEADHARACLDCGTLIPFLGPQVLQQLNRSLAAPPEAPEAPER